MSDSRKTAVATRLKESKQEVRRLGDEPYTGLQAGPWNWRAVMTRPLRQCYDGDGGRKERLMMMTATTTTTTTRPSDDEPETGDIQQPAREAEEHGKRERTDGS